MYSLPVCRARPPREYHVTPYVGWDDIAKEKGGMLNTDFKKNTMMLITKRLYFIFKK